MQGNGNPWKGTQEHSWIEFCRNLKGHSMREQRLRCYCSKRAELQLPQQNRSRSRGIAEHSVHQIFGLKRVQRGGSWERNRAGLIVLDSSSRQGS